MPYADNKDLPTGVRKSLPPHAQEIYREAFNNAWEEYKDSSKRRAKSSREEAARRVAWAAVKSKYMKLGNTWSPKVMNSNA